MHHGGPSPNVRAQTNPISVSDAHTTWHDVVDHSRKLVHAIHRHVMTLGTGAQASLIQPVDRHGPQRSPGHVVQQPEDAVQVDRARSHDPM